MRVSHRGGRAAAVLLVFCAGCGAKTYPVQGKLLWPDGSPITSVAGGMVVFESTSQPLSARGEIQPDGTFRLHTFREGDGVPLGRYRVSVIQPLLDGRDGPPPRIFLEKYERLDKSGLEATVEAKPNDVTLTLEPAPGRGKR